MAPTDECFARRRRRTFTSRCLFPTGSCATVAENGRFICQWLLQRPRGERIVLASLSKGSGDIKAALVPPRGGGGFRKCPGLD